jgi:hypothetical protein
MAPSARAKFAAYWMQAVFLFGHFVRIADLQLQDMKQAQRMSGNGHRELL